MAGDLGVVEPLVTKHGDRTSDMVALTFDDGPTARTEEALTILGDHGARATFFMVGASITGHEPLLRKVVDQGHEIGNHSFHHPKLPSLAEVKAASGLVRSITGVTPRSYRPPFGAITIETATEAKRAGFDIVLWDVNSEDVFPVWQGLEPTELYGTVMSQVRPGSIVLLHDGCPWSNALEALPALVAGLQDRGLRLVTIRELLGLEPSWRNRRRRRRWRPPARSRDLPSWYVTPSSLPMDQMGRLPPKQVIRYLKERALAERASGATTAALAAALAERVTANGIAFARLSEEVGRLQPLFVRSVLRGFERIVIAGRGRALPWDGPLRLIELALASLESSPPTSGAGQMVGWHDVLEAGLDLMNNGLAQRAVPIEAGDRVWSTIDALSWLDADAKHPNKAIAQLRAQGVGAVIQYAAWRKANARPAMLDLSDLPEVAANLERQLEPDRKPSRWVHATFGGRFVQLDLIDHAWLAQHVETIFGEGNGSDPGPREAWDVYLPWGWPTAESFDMLGTQYRLAVERLPTPDDERRVVGNHPDRALARHLSVLYATGVIDLDEDGLLQRFTERADARDIAHLLICLGSATERANIEIAGDSARRLKLAWERIAAWAVRRDHRERQVILAPFGLWYATAETDPDWLDAQLVLLLSQGIAVSFEFRVFERLAERMREAPGKTTEVAALFATTVRDPWRAYAVRENLLGVINGGLASTDPAVAARADEARRALEAKGFVDFAQLATEGARR
jgi:peptidoglycan-N-acetylglucosamine deacetylase